MVDGDAAPYVTPEQLRAALKLRDPSDPRLERICQAVSDSIDWFTGHTVPDPQTATWSGYAGALEPVVVYRMDPVPAIVSEVALAWAVEVFKAPDAAFHSMGLAESGPVRLPRETYRRFVEALAPVTIAYGLA